MRRPLVAGPSTRGCDRRQWRLPSFVEPSRRGTTTSNCSSQEQPMQPRLRARAKSDAKFPVADQSFFQSAAEEREESDREAGSAVPPPAAQLFALFRLRALDRQQSFLRCLGRRSGRAHRPCRRARVGSNYQMTMMKLNLSLSVSFDHIVKLIARARQT